MISGDLIFHKQSSVSMTFDGSMPTSSQLKLVSKASIKSDSEWLETRTLSLEEVIFLSSCKKLSRLSPHGDSSRSSVIRYARWLSAPKASINAPRSSDVVGVCTVCSSFETILFLAYKSCNLEGMS